MRDSGIVVPDDLDPSEETIPLDFTRLSDRRVGAVHSRFAVRMAHGLYARASVSTRLLQLKRKHILDLAKFRARYREDFKTIKECDEAFSLSPFGSKLERHIMELEIKNEILGAVVAGFEQIVKAASREMTRRGDERERAPRD